MLGAGALVVARVNDWFGKDVAKSVAPSLSVHVGVVYHARRDVARPQRELAGVAHVPALLPRHARQIVDPNARVFTLVQIHVLGQHAVGVLELAASPRTADGPGLHLAKQQVGELRGNANRMRAAESRILPATARAVRAEPSCAAHLLDHDSVIALV